MNKEFWLTLAEVVDALRLVPRSLVYGYGFVYAQMMYWAMGLKDISPSQAALLSTATGVIPFLLNFYMQTGRTWGGAAPVVVQPVVTTGELSK